MNFTVWMVGSNEKSSARAGTTPGVCEDAAEILRYHPTLRKSQRSLPGFPLPEWLMKALRHAPGLKRPTSLTQKFTKPSLAPFDRANRTEFNRRHKANAAGTFKAIRAHGDGFRKEVHRIGTGAKIERCSEQPSSGQQKSFKDIEPGRSAPHRSYVIRKRDRTRLENPRRT